MEFSLDKSSLLRVLRHMQGAVDKKDIISILSNVRITAKKGVGSAPGTITLTANNMDMQAEECVECDVKADGSIAVSMSTFADVVRKLSDGVVKMEIVSSENLLQILSGGAKFKLATMSAADFPVMKTEKIDYSASVDVKVLNSLLDKTYFAASLDESRFNLNGVLIHSENVEQVTMLRAVSTDGHRLSLAEVEVKDLAELPKIIIPRRCVQELQKLTEDYIEEKCTISISSKKASFAFTNLVYTTKLVDGEFPDYKKVIPSGNSKMMSIDKSLLSSSIDRVSSINSSNALKGVKFNVKSSELLLFASSGGANTGSESLSAKYTGGEDFETAYNARYVMEILAHVDTSTAVFKFLDGSSPAIISPEDTKGSPVSYYFVIMPMRL